MLPATASDPAADPMVPHHRTTPADMAQVPDADVLNAAMHQEPPSAPRADRRHRRPATTPPAQNAALDQPGDLMPVDVIGLRQRPGDPQTLELGHPPLVHQVLTVVDGFVAGTPPGASAFLGVTLHPTGEWTASGPVT